MSSRPGAGAEAVLPPASAASTAVHIRSMAAPDLPAYKALRDLMLALHPDAFTSDAATELRRPPETYLSRLAGAADHGWPFTLTAWRGECLLGAITCEQDGRLKVSHIAQVVGMMVHPEATGCGLGGALLDAAVGQCRQRGGIEMLTLSVTGTNAAAIRLYERAGFTRYGQLARALRVGATYHDKHLMALSLNTGG
jgi:ribosomal protein S18 acetylase RimI-like enzyme